MQEDTAHLEWRKACELTTEELRQVRDRDFGKLIADLEIGHDPGFRAWFLEELASGRLIHPTAHLSKIITSGEWQRRVNKRLSVDGFYRVLRPQPLKKLQRQGGIRYGPGGIQGNGSSLSPGQRLSGRRDTKD
jgi:hypothetical protein